jgi:hypothetical protein
MGRNQPHSPSPSVAEPRRPLLLAVLSFVRAAEACPGVRRVSLMGSIVTAKAIPNDIDVLVTIGAEMELSKLARAGARSGAQMGNGSVRRDGFWAGSASDPVDTIAVYRLGDKIEPELLAHHASQEPSHRVGLPPRQFHDGGDRDPARSAQHFKHPCLLGFRSRPVTRGSALRAVALDRFLEAERRLIDRARVLLDIAKTPLHGVGAPRRRTAQSPRRPYGAGGVRGASRLRRLCIQ